MLIHMLCDVIIISLTIFMTIQKPEEGETRTEEKKTGLPSLMLPNSLHVGRMQIF